MFFRKAVTAFFKDEANAPVLNLLTFTNFFKI